MPEERRNVWFITPKEGVVRVRLVSADSTTIKRTADVLNACYAIAADGEDPSTRDLIWAVFDTTKATKLGVIGWSLPIPERMFVSSSPDPAIMYALAKGAAR